MCVCVGGRVSIVNPELFWLPGLGWRTPMHIRVVATPHQLTISFSHKFWGSTWEESIFNSITNQAAPWGAQPGVSSATDAWYLHSAQTSAVHAGLGLLHHVTKLQGHWGFLSKSKKCRKPWQLLSLLAEIDLRLQEPQPQGRLKSLAVLRLPRIGEVGAL